MADEMHVYEGDVSWIDDRRTEVSIGDRRIEVDSPPEFGGPEGQLYPETLFPSVLASCLLTTFLEFKDRMGINLKTWNSHVTAELGPSPEKGFKFHRIRIHVKIGVNDEDKEKIPRAMQLAEKYCFISRAIRNNVEEIVEYEFV
ncbi:OsmC family protein [Thermoplasma sp.]|uniref:OsmC family protein n=1 Tax=Thermoplasma sp. TaxID=1973142 RepID=UPI0025F21182|nr:OsmC family protein [Thermoplasma sp.]